MVASVGERWVAEQAARLLELPLEAVASFTPETLRSGLVELVKGAFKGSVVRASRESGLSRASVCTWVKGATPGLPWLLQLCFTARADVVALLGGSFRLLENDGSARESIDVMPRTYNQAALTAPEISQLLRQAVSEPEPPTLRQFALRNGLHPDTPRHRFPEEATALARARATYEERAREQRFRQAVGAYTAAGHSLQQRGLAVHAKSLQTESGLVAFSQHPPRVRALNAALTGFRNQAGSQERAVA